MRELDNLNKYPVFSKSVQNPIVRIQHTVFRNLGATMGDNLAMSHANRPTTFYYGTSIEFAMRIQVYGFDISLSGSSSGELLGKGVYCTPVLMKAVDYARCKPSHGVVLELLCDPGHCKKLTPNDPMRKTWQLHKFDSAWMPNGANDRNMAENCIKDAARITLVRIIAGDTWQLKQMGMFIRPSDGRLSMIDDQVSSSQSRAAKRKRESAPPLADGDLSFHALLCLWKLEDVSDLLADEGVTDTKVLTEELKEEDIAKMAIGQIYKNQLSKLLQHVLTQSVLRTTHISSGLEILGQMRKEPDNAGIQLSASSALLDLLRCDDSIVAELTTQGMLSLLVTAISSHTTEIQLHRNTFKLIDLVLFTNHNTTLEVGNLISALFGSMEMNYRDEGLKLQCVETLMTLVKEIKYDRGIKKTIIVSQDTISVLLVTMDAHVMHLLLQSAICCFLSELAKLTQFIEAIVIAGGMRSVMASDECTPARKIHA